MASFVRPRFESWATGPGGLGNLTVVDKAPAYLLDRIDPYWHQFPPMNPLWHSILGFAIFMLGMVAVNHALIYSIICDFFSSSSSFLINSGMIAIIGNGTVIFIFTTTKSLRTPSNLFIVNLAFSDFMMMSTNAPMMVVNCYHETWHFGGS